MIAPSRLFGEVRDVDGRPRPAMACKRSASAAGLGSSSTSVAVAQSPAEDVAARPESRNLAVSSGASHAERPHYVLPLPLLPLHVRFDAVDDDVDEEPRVVDAGRPTMNAPPRLPSRRRRLVPSPRAASAIVHLRVTDADFATFEAGTRAATFPCVALAIGHSVSNSLR